MSTVDLSRVRYEHGYCPVTDLHPYARNSRTHSPVQVQQLAASIRQFGFTNPVLVDDAGGIVAGHGRVLAAESLGLTEVPVIRLTGLTELQRRAYVIADNKLALNAGWDEDKLRIELQDLKSSEFDVDVLGFDAEELASILNQDPPDDGRADDAPEVPAVAISRAGDVWSLGPHRVVCGDSTGADVWRAVLGDERVDCVWTDPPYNVAYVSKIAGSIKNDDMTDAAFKVLLRGAFERMFDVLKPGGGIYVAHADTEGLNFRSAFVSAGFKLSGCLIWKKNALVLGRSDYQWIHEPILYGWKPGSKHRWFGGRKQTTVQEIGESSPFSRLEDGRWAIRVGDQTLVVAGDAVLQGAEPSSLICHDKPSRSAEHPTMKPVSLIERMLKFSARPGDIVADAFGGSGSTLIAADRMGMCARIIELDPRFVDVIVRRWQQYTGRKASHGITGEPFPD